MHSSLLEELATDFISFGDDRRYNFSGIFVFFLRCLILQAPNRSLLFCTSGLIAYALVLFQKCEICRSLNRAQQTASRGHFSPQSDSSNTKNHKVNICTARQGYVLTIDTKILLGMIQTGQRQPACQLYKYSSKEYPTTTMLLLEASFFPLPTYYSRY